MIARVSSGPREQVHAALDRSCGLALLRGVLDDGPGRAMLALLRALTAESPLVATVAAAYSRAFLDLAGVADEEPVAGLADAWQAHLTARLLDDANPWSLGAERGGAAGVAPGLAEQARRDVQALRLLCDLDAQMLWRLSREAVAGAVPALADAWVPWTALASRHAEDGGNEARATLRRRLVEADDWAALTDDLAAHWARHGTGLVARYRALRWEGPAVGFRGIAHPDPIALDQLVGYGREHALLTANVERFLAGRPAHDTLLYGAPGTGKSSTVKALANRYAGRGLRLLEVRKEDLGDLPSIAALVRDRAPRFLLFVDDLSFEEHETEYKALKALLEGAAEARPRNLAIMATTNRRNLVRESFADREMAGDGMQALDVHGRDTMQEKVSLAARFGLRVTFASPNQETYLTIAAALARGRGLTLDEEEVRARALRWERQHPGRSGRTARQFVDELEAAASEPGEPKTG